MSTLQTTAITPPMTFDQARDRGVVGMVEHEPPRKEITMSTPNLEQIAEETTNEIAAAAGKCLAGSWEGPTSFEAWTYRHILAALRAVAQPEPKRFPEAGTVPNNLQDGGVLPLTPRGDASPKGNPGELRPASPSATTEQRIAYETLKAELDYYDKHPTEVNELFVPQSAVRIVLQMIQTTKGIT